MINLLNFASTDFTLQAEEKNAASNQDSAQATPLVINVTSCDALLNLDCIGQKADTNGSGDSVFAETPDSTLPSPAVASEIGFDPVSNFEVQPCSMASECSLQFIGKSEVAAHEISKESDEAAFDIMKKRVARICLDELPDDPFYVADIGEVIRQHDRWVKALPLVSPFYAVKCNPDPIILRALAGLGTGFDCASRAEIAAILDLNMDIDPSTQIIYANPCKAASHIRYAASVGVRMMTFDNADELYKIKKFHKNSPQLVLRIITDDSRSLCRFGVKFGASLSQVSDLLTIARSLDLDVIGISFHVGSGCFDARAFGDAIVSAREAFNIADSLGFEFTLLDIGGGFPGAESHTGVKFSEIVEVVRPVLEKLFSGVNVISEPGRYFVSSAYTLAVNVHARRIIPHASGDTSKTTFMYYINEGLYSSLNCIYYDHATVSPKVLLKDGNFLDECTPSSAEKRVESVANAATLSSASVERKEYICSIWGPTCDSMDMITKDGKLPELNVGDWLFFEWMGAYTVAAATTFNGFAKCNVIWTNTESLRHTI